MSTIKLTLGYTGTDFVREFKINDVDDTDSALETVRAKVKAVNESLAGGTSDGLDVFFRSDDFDSDEGIGNLNAIKSCRVVYEEEVNLI
ncbi:MAG: hypothetical protein IJG33_13520 [Selenomonadaceae bacterium]|nr:hypothetical protein [Selenomonadaceae bacterium]